MIHNARLVFVRAVAQISGNVHFRGLSPAVLTAVVVAVIAVIVVTAGPVPNVWFSVNIYRVFEKNVYSLLSGTKVFMVHVYGMCI